MRIAAGVDLVYLPRFKKSLKIGGENFLRRIFNEKELGETDHLAGIFAAKEAIIKALNLATDAWNDISIIHHPSGAPKAEIRSAKLADEIKNSSLSISHSGNYVVAQFVAILK